MHEQGWYRDPYHVHEDRYFSDGTPTKLVRDGAAEAYDEAPAIAVPEVPEKVWATDPGDPSDVLRAGDIAPTAPGPDLHRADEADAEPVVAGAEPATPTMYGLTTPHHGQI